MLFRHLNERKNEKRNEGMEGCIRLQTTAPVTLCSHPVLDWLPLNASVDRHAQCLLSSLLTGRKGKENEANTKQTNKKNRPCILFFKDKSTKTIDLETWPSFASEETLCFQPSSRPQKYLSPKTFKDFYSKKQPYTAQKTDKRSWVCQCGSLTNMDDMWIIHRKQVEGSARISEQYSARTVSPQ